MTVKMRNIISVRFEVYNKSSENMEEIDDMSIDFAVADPPFNIGCFYSGIIDSLPHEEYLAKIKRVTSEIARALSPDGLAVFLLPDLIKKQGKFYRYPEIYSKICNGSGLRSIDSFHYTVNEDDPDCVPEENIRAYDRDCHSEEITGIVFSKSEKKINEFPRARTYRYSPKDGHPCPFPPELIDDILNTFYTNGERVLDPFMGTAGLGEEVLKRNGLFFGYETVKDIFDTAKEKLEMAH